MLPAKRGSMLFFNYLTIHGSTANRSGAARRALFIQVRDPGDRPTEVTHLSHAQGMMLAGLDPMRPGNAGAERACLRSRSTSRIAKNLESERQHLEGA